MWEHYYTPATVNEALTLLHKHGTTARIIAGGTDIIIELDRGQRPDVNTLIDISRIPGLDAIALGEDGRIHMGPLVNQNHVIGSSLIVERALPLAQASWSEAAPQIRNRATVAGNLITASPANDTIPPLLALNADVVLRSVNGERTVPLAKFYTGVRRTVMQPDELLTDIRFRPLDPQTQRGMFIKLGLRRAQAISVVNIAVVLSFDNGKITDARITLGSVAPIVVHAQEAERTLIGEVLTEKAIARAAAQAVAAASPIDDVRGPAEYRREMCRVLTEQALTAIMQERERADFPAQPVMLWGSEQARVTAALPESFHHTAEEPIETTINGVSTTVEGGASKTLLRMLREDAGLIGTKEGCAEGECGACTVFLDGAAVMACMVAAPRAHRAEIVTIEGLAANGDLHPVQRGFIEAGAVQCGYCTPGFIMAGAKLLEETATPSEWQIQQSITGNLCRCTGYYKINMALLKAAQIAARED